MVPFSTKSDLMYICTCTWLQLIVDRRKHFFFFFSSNFKPYFGDMLWLNLGILNLGFNDWLIDSHRHEANTEWLIVDTGMIAGLWHWIEIEIECLLTVQNIAPVLGIKHILLISMHHVRIYPSTTPSGRFQYYTPGGGLRPILQNLEVAPNGSSNWAI
jgi:hypothetical protein